MEISKEKYFEEAKEILKKYCNNDREAVAEAYRRYRRKCQSNNKLKRMHKPMRRFGY